MNTNKNKALLYAGALSIIFILISNIVYFLKNDFRNWALSLAALAIIIFLQIFSVILIKNVYKKILSYNSIFLTIVSIYTFSVTAFYFFALILIKITKDHIWKLYQ